MTQTPESLQEKIDQLESSAPVDGDYARVNNEIKAIQDQIIRLQWGTGEVQNAEDQAVTRNKKFKAT